jgi:hypothetical protein
VETRHPAVATVTLTNDISVFWDVIPCSLVATCLNIHHTTGITFLKTTGYLKCNHRYHCLKISLRSCVSMSVNFNYSRWTKIHSQTCYLLAAHLTGTVFQWTQIDTKKSQSPALRISFTTWKISLKVVHLKKIEVSNHAGLLMPFSNISIWSSSAVGRL